MQTLPTSNSLIRQRGNKSSAYVFRCSLHESGPPGVGLDTPAIIIALHVCWNDNTLFKCCLNATDPNSEIDVGLWSPGLSLHRFCIHKTIFIKIYKDATFATNMPINAPFSWAWTIWVWTPRRISRAEGNIWDNFYGGCCPFQKKKAISVEVLLITESILFEAHTAHFSDLPKALYTLSQCYTGCFFF